MSINGYLNQKYAHSFEELGKPIQLPQSKGWILKRKIPESSYYDAMGCYPLFSCQNWSKLYDDLENMDDDIISLSIITDPFGDYNIKYLKKCFKDIVINYKNHFVVDLNKDINNIVTKGHRKNSRKGLKKITVEVIKDPMQFLEEWESLYDFLIKKHNIKGMLTFSHQAFKNQFKVPGFTIFRAIHNDETVGMNSWYIEKDVGYAHLAAYTEIGYKMYASYALFWYIIDFFSKRGLRWLELGSAPGMKNKVNEGLSQFKRGWSTGTKPVYLCGRIFDNSKYSEIVKAKKIVDTDYFPAYRKGEFK